MNLAKIRLSAKEMELAQNAEWILTKNTILDKCVLLFSHLQTEQQLYLQPKQKALPVEWQHLSPKISKGENYLGLPYRLLDYPAYFQKESFDKQQTDIVAIRTMFWWGNFFSVTLHIAGDCKAKYQQRMIGALPRLKEANAYICINNNQWQHHFSNENYVLLHNYSADEAISIINKHPFIKIAIKLPLSLWQQDAMPLLSAFKTLADILID